MRRYVAIWFPYLLTDWYALQVPARRTIPFALKATIRGRMVITSVNPKARASGIHPGISVADAKAIEQALEVHDEPPEISARLLRKLGEWCIQFSPVVAVELPDMLVLDSTGCAHLWGGEKLYLECIRKKLNRRGYHIRLTMADTMTLAMGLSRFDQQEVCISNDPHMDLLSLPPEALQLDGETLEKMHKLGFRCLNDLSTFNHASLRARFGNEFITKYEKARGNCEETFHPIVPVMPCRATLPCMEPVTTADAIVHALTQLLQTLCCQLITEQKGMRKCTFTGYRTDGTVTSISIGTHSPTNQVDHLLGLFALNLNHFDPGWGIDTFILEVPVAERLIPRQSQLWKQQDNVDKEMSELMDRLSGRLGEQAITRYLPAEHHWPERSIKKTDLIGELSDAQWPKTSLRPLLLLRTPEKIEVSAPIPDYPPMLFRYKGQVHKIVKADGPERIEAAWWIRDELHRDYYKVEDDRCCRYWLFRAGHYQKEQSNWFLHGFFP